MANIPVKKLKNGFQLPVFGFGTWQMGGREKRDASNDDRADIRAIQKALDMGITHIDTAAWYAQGHTEELVGQAIKGRDRAKILVTTKVSPMDLNYKDVLRSAGDSLKRLGTDYIDIYVIHNPNPYIEISQTMQAMDKLLKDGLVRHLGLSNFNISQFKQAQGYSCNNIVCNHLHYNLKHRGPLLDGTIKFCQDNGIMVVAWRPVQKGLFSEGRFQILKKLAQKYEKTQNQIAINWLVSQKNVVTISKTRNIGHLVENIGSLGFKMEPGDIRLLMEDFPDKVATVENVTLAKLIEKKR